MYQNFCLFNSLFINDCIVSVFHHYKLWYGDIFLVYTFLYPKISLGYITEVVSLG